MCISQYRRISWAFWRRTASRTYSTTCSDRTAREPRWTSPASPLEVSKCNQHFAKYTIVFHGSPLLYMYTFNYVNYCAVWRCAHIYTTPRICVLYIYIYRRAICIIVMYIAHKLCEINRLILSQRSSSYVYILDFLFFRIYSIYMRPRWGTEWKTYKLNPVTQLLSHRALKPLQMNIS